MAKAKSVATRVFVNGEERILEGAFTAEDASERFPDADDLEVRGELTQKEYDAYQAGLEAGAAESGTQEATVDLGSGAEVPASTTGGQTSTASATLTHDGGESKDSVNVGAKAGSQEQDEAGNPIGGDDKAGTNGTT